MFRNAVGLDLPRSASEMASLGDKIGSRTSSRATWCSSTPCDRTFSHVGIYLGDGKFVHAPSSGKRFASRTSPRAYWAKRFNGARRLVDEESLGLSAQVMRTH